MATTKEIKGRVVLKHDTAANWKTAGDNGFCPLANEIIMFDPDDSCAMIRYKIGRWANNEKTELVNINDLPFESNVYVGPYEPENAPAGFMWLDTSENDEIIKFYIRHQTPNYYPDYPTKTYYAEKDMTFREWVQSDYNILGYKCLQFNHYHGEIAPEENEADHIRGIGLVFYSDGTTGDGSDEGKQVYEDHVLSDISNPTMGGTVIDTGLTDCDNLISANSTYYVVAFP